MYLTPEELGTIKAVLTRQWLEAQTAIVELEKIGTGQTAVVAVANYIDQLNTILNKINLELDAEAEKAQRSTQINAVGEVD